MSITRGARQFQIANYGYAPQSYCINGGFEVWQRGNGPFITPNKFTCDEWRVQNYSLGAMSVTRFATPLSGTYCITATTTGASVDIAIEQGIEAYKSLQGLWVTLSVSVKTSVANCNRAWISDYDGSTQNTVASALHTGSGNWERLSCTKLIRPTLQSNPLWPHSFGIDCGVHFNNAATALIDDATLVIGNYPEGVPFIPKNPEEDFRDCQRFYEVMGLASAASICPLMYGVATTPVGQGIQFQTQKAATPTITKVGTWNVSNCGQPTCPNADVKGYTLTAAVTVTGAAYFYNNAADYISAEVP